MALTCSVLGDLTPCVVEGCPRPVTCRSCRTDGTRAREGKTCRYCSTHYQRLRKYGDPLAGGPIRKFGDGWKRKGYRQFYDKDHPNSDATGAVYEHTKVMSEILGRPLRQGESVHHVNGVRDDNRPENLELWVVHQPKGQRVEDLVVWARQVLEEYGDQF